MKSRNLQCDQKSPKNPLFLYLAKYTKWSQCDFWHKGSGILENKRDVIKSQKIELKEKSRTGIIKNILRQEYEFIPKE